MRWSWMILLWPLSASGETPKLTVEGGLPAGTASELKPLAWSAELGLYLVERIDKRPSGTKVEVERSWNFHGRALELVAYAVLTTDGVVSTQNAQWMGGGNDAQKHAVAELTGKAHEKLVTEPKLVDKLWADWQKLKSVPCPVKTTRREGGVEVVANQMAVASIDTPLSPADGKRGCSAPAAGALRCTSGAESDVIVVVPFKQDCGVAQQLLVSFNARSLDYLKEAQAGELALKKGDLAGAKKHLEACLKLEPKHAPAIFAHAAVAARSAVAFREGRVELEQILGHEEQRQMWLPRIKADANFERWRADPEFKNWFAQFPTRVPIK